MGAFKNLEVLDLSNSGIAGMVPQIDAWFSLAVFRVAGNALSGVMPEAMLQNSMRLVEVDLSRNGFSGIYLPFASQMVLLSLSKMP